MAGSARKKYTFSQYFEKNRHFCRKLSPKPYFRVLLFSPSCSAFHFRQAGIYHDQSFFPACHGEPPNHFPFVFPENADIVQMQYFKVHIHMLHALTN